MMRKRDLAIIWISVIAAIALAVSIFSRQALETGSWGLSFRTEGAPPIGNAGTAQLQAYALSLGGEAPAWECSLGASFPSERALPAGGFGSVHTPSP